jgi:hypothetical protein
MGTSRVEAETRKLGQPRDPSNNQTPAATRQDPPTASLPVAERPDAHSKTGAPCRFFAPPDSEPTLGCLLQIRLICAQSGVEPAICGGSGCGVVSAQG